MVKPSVAQAAQCAVVVCALLAACRPTPAAGNDLITSVASTATISSIETRPTQTVFVAENNKNTVSIADINILSPGPDSQLISPIELKTQLLPGAGGKVRIELYGSDGRLMARKILVYDAASQAELDVRIDFETSHASETARLVVRTEDAYGRVQALNSVAAVLLAQGEPSIKPAPLEPEGITIASPEAGAVNTGGTVTVTGAANIPAGRPLNVQLITREGRVLAFNEVYPTFKEGQTLGTFKISLPYRVKETTWAQIAISEGDGVILVPIHFAGVEVQLEP